MDFLIWVALQAVVIGVVWWIMKRKRDEATGKVTHIRSRDDSTELRELKELRSKQLNMPLAELARPQTMSDIIGQEDGIRALRAAMCGANPQHVLIYGPPGIGKTCAARLVLEEARACEESPFGKNAKFIEVDATCVRFDERAIADPLIGSVHDPIYQGAGSLGTQGVPQPKAGAVTKAHCGVLFLDEIGELHPVQLNKLLKVLEDRRVFFESAYYSPTNTSIPAHIHDIFQNGLPADFRLIGATTRSPEEIPPALRSRCVELFFSPLGQKELEKIVMGAAERLEFDMDMETVELCAAYCSSGRDAANIVQLAGGAAHTSGRKNITKDDILWVAKTCRYPRRMAQKLSDEARVGTATGLGVTGGGQGVVIEIECTIKKAHKGLGTLNTGGMVEQEALESHGRRLTRKGTARVSAENVLEMFRVRFGFDCRGYDIAFNVPGGVPLDGPSAGIAMSVALMSAIVKKPPHALTALTGEITGMGDVRGVGGVREKLNAAIEAGAKTLIIPAENHDASFDELDAQLYEAKDITEVMRVAFDIAKEAEFQPECFVAMLSAQSVSA